MRVKLCINTSIDAATLSATQSGYSGKNLRESGLATEHTARELVDEKGFRLIRWEGSKACPIVDVEGRIYAVLAGRPRDKHYSRLAQEAADLILQLRESKDFSHQETDHRRGDYPTVTFGVSQGNGNGLPHSMKQEQHAELIDKIRNHPAVQFIAEFSGTAFATWAPKLHAHYTSYMTKLQNKMPDLELTNFAGSPFACATVNLGPQVRTFKHRDVMNLAFGWCAITALGQFNHRKGGHLVLWEPQLVIQFPHGSTILIPSAALTHSNTPVLPTDTRVSFTQYTAAGLFRFVDNNFKTQHVFQSSKTVEDVLQQEVNAEEDGVRFLNGVNMYSNLSDIS